MAIFLCLLFLIVSSAMACERCVHQTKATFVDSKSATKSGACGYVSYATKLNGGYTAAAVPSLYKDGAGCGACFQVRCKNPNLGTKKGTDVVVTDLQGDNSTDFVLSAKPFSAMAKPGMDKSLLKLGVVNVEYKRIPCDYKNRNLTVRVEESSRKPDYLAIKLLYQGGQTEILTVEVTQAGTSPALVSMSRSYGAVWDTGRVPSGALRFRFAVTGGFDPAFYWTETVLPADWKNGGVYDTGVQINDIAQEMCSPCDSSIRMGWDLESIKMVNLCSFLSGDSISLLHVHGLLWIAVFSFRKMHD